MARKGFLALWSVYRATGRKSQLVLHLTCAYPAVSYVEADSRDVRESIVVVL